MAYGTKYWDYQVAIIFAILLAAILILAAFFVGIYYLVVAPNRNKKAGAGGPRTRTPSSMPATRTAWQPAPQPIQQPPTPYSPTNMQRQLPQEYTYDPRLVSTQPGYVQQPLVQNYNPSDFSGAKVRELQPEYVYQQGPITWTSSQQVHETGYPISPVQQMHANTASAYHTSSV